jgi:gas vesicle protein
MTDTDRDQIRIDIERTRRELGGDVDALADKVTPSKIMRHQTDKVESAFGSVSDRVMDTASYTGDAVSSATDSIGKLPHQAANTATGNPLAVGLIAFGIGWLAASLVPASEKEKELAGSLKEAAQPLISEAADAAKQVADKLREPAQEAVAAVKDSAEDAIDEVRAAAHGAANDVKDEAQSAKDTVTETAKHKSDADLY